MSETVAARPRLISRCLALVFVCNFGAMTGFYLLLSVVPLYAASAGVGEAGAGVATAALMAATVAAELVTPGLASRLGYRRVLAGGLVLLGAPSLMLVVPGSGDLAVVTAVSLLRGAGLAVAVVVGSALVAALVPPQRRGEALGVSGLVVMGPAVLGLPLGVWLAEQAGYPVVFVLAAVVTLAGLAVVPALPDRIGSDGREAPLGIVAALRDGRLARPALVFAVPAAAAGVVVTFLPSAVTHRSLAAVGLFVQAGTATAARVWAGRVGDRRGSARLLAPGVLLAAAGLAGPVWDGSPVTVVAGMAVFGAGWGIAQNASLSLMYERVPVSAYGTVSAVWNLAYDGGMGLGAVGFGVMAASAGYPPAFAVTAMAMPLILLLVLADRRGSRHR
ncbi:MFS transporter [Spirillospora sp. NPDC048911]|uniref:MFS transporter n=1 Tax=Spirillospora sp. NPDC048911 TaxID=3364527 RepID=UPI003723892C